MSTRIMVAAGVCAAALLAGAGFAMNGAGNSKIETASLEAAPAMLSETEAAQLAQPEAVIEAAIPAEPIVVAAAPKPDCRKVATVAAGFDPAMTSYPVRDDAGNRQALKGAAVGAAAGAVGGELIADRAGKGAIVGAAAGAIGGHAMKKRKQREADERYGRQVADYQQSKAAYDAALSVCLAA